MTITRRDLGAVLAGLSAMTNGSGFAQQPSHTDAANPVAAGHKPAHDMHSMPQHWFGKEQIGLLIYPSFTALDMVGPHYMLTNLMGATTHIIAKTKDPVVSDTGLVFTPSITFEECPKDLDVLFVPGGSSGTLMAIRDPDTVQFVSERGKSARFVTSVCTGSLILGAAGLLNGYRATSHWMTLSLLEQLGATPESNRVVIDRNRITGAGVTAGIDFGLFLVSQMRDQKYAETVQLLAEYDPDPPFNSGNPKKASPDVKAIMDDMFVSFLAEAKQTLPTIKGK
jgi:cyclohexyl-isocyanide hydratase